MFNFVKRRMKVFFMLHAKRIILMGSLFYETVKCVLLCKIKDIFGRGIGMVWQGCSDGLEGGMDGLIRV